MAKILPILLMLIGGGIGAGAGFLLKPAEEMTCDPEHAEEDCEPADDHTEEAEEEEPGAELYYLTMKSQFVVPIIQNEVVSSLVVLSLSLETTPDQTEMLFSHEPKLRDVFLQVLFDHSHIGGFNGAFTESSRLSVLKVALLEAAQSVAGKAITDVIITDIVRQEQ